MPDIARSAPADANGPAAASERLPEPRTAEQPHPGEYWDLTACAWRRCPSR